MDTLYIHKDQDKDKRYDVRGLLRHDDGYFSFRIESKDTRVAFFNLTALELIDLGHAIHDLGTQAMEMEEASDGKD
jgi:hypothetical protein